MVEKVDYETVVDFVVPRDKKNPTTWKLAPVPSTIASRFAMTADEHQWDATVKALQASIKGWENFNVPYETEEQDVFGTRMQVVPIKIINLIPPLVLLALAKKVYDISHLSDEAVKN